MSGWDTVSATGQRTPHHAKPVSEADRINRQGGTRGQVLAAMTREELRKERAKLLKEVAEIDAAIAIAERHS